MVAAKPVPAAKVTPVKPETTEGTATGETSKETAQENIEPAEKNNILPTVVVLSIVVGCVAIVTIGKKIT
ncbi:MAG: hypothetical protein JW787_07775 [Sedimentisphaerales bacterium]|nr:hypothetical protein [Sedimentisphaerales bacterium]